MKLFGKDGKGLIPNLNDSVENDSAAADGRETAERGANAGRAERAGAGKEAGRANANGTCTAKAAKRSRKSIKELFQPTKSLRAGSYSFAVAAIVIAIAVAANLFVGALPESLTKIDTTAQGLYSLSAQTESIVAALKDDINIYWIVQAGQEDTTVSTLLGRYESLSKKVNVIKKDPDVYPTFASQYTSDRIYNNSLIVESGTRSRYISYADIYSYDYSNYYTTGSYSVSFDGENELTSAIDYVVSESIPVLYALSGHGESTLPSTYESAVLADNVEVKSLSIITENAVPEDASCVLIYSPQNDISAEELEILKAYALGGGSILLITDPLQPGSERSNLDALAAVFGMSETEGILIEGSSDNYAYGAPYYLLPNYGSHEITSALSSAGYYVLLPLAHGIELTDTAAAAASEAADAGSGTVAFSAAKALLTTSSSAYSKLAGYEMTTYEKEDGDPEGSFTLAAIAEASTDTGTAAFIWISSAAVMDEMTSMQVAGGNEDFFLNCLSYVCGEESSISIRAKSLSYDYLTMSSSQASALRVIMVVLIPAAFVCAGIYITVRRKRR